MAAPWEVHYLLYCNPTVKAGTCRKCPAGWPNTPSNSSRSSAAKPPPIADTVDGRMFYQADYWDWVAKENAKRNDSPQSAGRPMPAGRPKQGKKAKNVPAQAKRRKTAPSASAKKGKKARQPH